jgi:hypothetical protein
MDPSVYDMMKTMLAEKAATQSAKKVKAEPVKEHSIRSTPHRHLLLLVLIPVPKVIEHRNHFH